MSHKLYNVGMYIRLSVEDKHYGESVSIENQHTMLSQFVSHMPNWIATRAYVDEGVSGGNFNRKGFQDMMEDVRAGIINLVIVKDLSRFGRNYLEAGRYLEEELPALGCRFVALADGIDTEDGENDIIPFLNAINDFYIRDCSERIKTVLTAKAKEGHKLGGITPYGYIRNPDERSRLIVDEEAASVIRRIFELRVSGQGYTAIAGILTKEGIPSPRTHYFNTQGKVNKAPVGATGACAKIWATRTVKLILNNEIYIGHTAQLKRGTRSYRDNRAVWKDESDWIRVENTHAPIIEKDLWDKVQELNLESSGRTANAKQSRPNIFAGLLICPDCGAKMNRIVKTYYCGAYQRSGKAACSPHKLLESDLKDIVHAQVKNTAKKITLDESRMLESLRAKLIKGYKDGKTSMAKKRQLLGKQLYALENQIDHLYENKVEGVISAETFMSLSKSIEAKRTEVEFEFNALNQQHAEIKSTLADIEKWAALIKEKSTSLEVDRDLLEALIDKIEIGEKYEKNGQDYQEVRIYYKYVGLC